ncbi:MAG: ATP-binding cassette domain-containing protein [Clostridia bacterium]|nr:ATP-binding cassette domain-containing protein [Clostridia bacterium]
MAEERKVLLRVENLRKYYPAHSQGLWPVKEFVKAVDDVSFDIYEGETLGLVGESGSGKSTVGRQLVALEKPDGGSILYRGTDLVKMSDRAIREIRREIQMVFQDPNSSLNPRKHIREILAEPMLHHKLVDKAGLDKALQELLDLVGLPRNTLGRYPYEFSGGQRQRLGIAKALSLQPKLLVLDEPVSALDVSIQAQILNLLRDLQKELKLTYLFIAHGLGAVHYISDRIAVMYLGKIMEVATGTELFCEPRHPYTLALKSADPLPDPGKRGGLDIVLEGEVPSAINPPSGCRFHTRCPYAEASCRTDVPPLVAVSDGEIPHLAACPVWQRQRRAAQ